MTSQWTYTVTHWDFDTTTETVITEQVNSIPMFTDTGSEEVNSARIVLSGNKGDGLTTGVIFDQFDRIRIQGTDGQGGTYNKVFEIEKIIPTRTKGQGLQIVLMCFGLERHLQRMNYIKNWFNEGYFEVTKDIGDYYNTNRGTKQPVLLGHDNVSNNTLPDQQVQKNDYDFGTNEASCFDRLNEVVDKAGGSVDNGGLLDFYDIRFDSDPTNFTDITMNIYSSGSNISVVTITAEGDTAVNTGESEAGIDAEKATVSGSWGGIGDGALQLGHSKFKSKEQRFPLHPEWTSGWAYKIDSRVRFEGVHYKRITTDVVLPPPTPSADANWIVITTASEYGDVFTYSDYTRGRVDHWQDSGCDMRAVAAHFGDGFFDGNIVIQDDQEGVFKTWADVRGLDPLGVNVDLKYGASTTGEYRGMRMLVNGTAGGILATDQFGTGAGKDRNGKTYTKSVIDFDEFGEWRVIYPELNDTLYAILNEGITYQNITGTITDVSTTVGMNDTWHPYDELIQVPGVLSKDNGATDTAFTANTNSAIRVRYQHDNPTIVVDTLVNNLDATMGKTYNKVGAWLNLRFPFPVSTINNAGPVGTIFGGAPQVAGVPDADKEPATLDQQNMHLTPDGFRGFNQGDKSMGYGQINAIEFYMRLKFYLSGSATFIGGGTLARVGNFNMRCLMFDTADNVLFQDFVLPFNDKWEPIKLPISGFQPYRARRPLENILSGLVPPKPLEIQNIFQWRNIKHIIFQTQDSYDDTGRYQPLPTVANLGGSRFWQISVSLGQIDQYRRVELSLDAFRFTKPLLVISAQDTVKDIEQPFDEKPSIGDFFQLQNDNDVTLQKAKFRHIEFKLETTGKYDIPYGDRFDFTDDEIIHPAFVEGGDPANTIRLVNKRGEYSITKPKGGKGGFLRTIGVGVKRFV